MPPRRGGQLGGCGAAGLPGRGAAAAGPRAAAPPTCQAPGDSGLVALRDALPLIRAATDQLQRMLADGAQPLAQGQLQSLHDVLQRAGKEVPIRSREGARAGRACILADPAVASPLLQLAAAAVRVPPEQCWGAADPAGQGAARAESMLAAVRAAHAAAQLLHESCLASTQPADGAPNLLRVCDALLRMRVLHSCAQQLAGAAELLRSGRPVLTGCRPADVLRPWSMCLTHLSTLTHHVHMVAPAQHDNAPPAGIAACAALCSRLAAALRASRVLDHAAQGLVALAARRECRGEMVAEVNGLLERWFRGLLAWCAPCVGNDTCFPAARAAVDDLAAALRPPCVQHLLAAGGVLALRQADGGPVYGLDTELYGRLYPPGGSGAWRATDRSSCLWWLMCLSTNGQSMSGFVPERDWCDVLLRVVAVAAARTPPAAVYVGYATAITHFGLSTLAAHLGRPAMLVQQREEAWRLLLLVCDLEAAAGAAAGQRLFADEDSQRIGRFCNSLVPADGALPVELSLLPALAAGVMPYLERTLRQSTRPDPAAPLYADLALHLMCGLPRLQMLTHGSPVQCAALLATLRKVVRHCQPARLATPGKLADGTPWKACEYAHALLNELYSAAQALGAGGAAGGGAAGASGTGPGAAAAAAAATAGNTLRGHARAGARAAGAAATRPGAAGAGEAGQAAAQGQGPSVHPHTEAAGLPPEAALPQLTLAVLELLPAFSALLLRAEAEVPRLVAGAAEGSAVHRYSLETVSFYHYAVHIWCIWLLQTVSRAAGSSQPGGTALGGQGGGGEGACCGGWRDVLLQRVRVAELVGAGLRFYARSLRLPVSAPDQVMLRLHALLTVAQQVLQEFPQAAREAAAQQQAGATSSAGAHSGSTPGSTPGSGAQAAGGGGGGGGGAANAREAEALAAWPLAEVLQLASTRAAGHPLLHDVCGTIDIIMCALTDRPTLRTLVVPPMPPWPLSTVAEARALLRTCSHVDCASFKGDSEAAAQLLVCGKCRGAWYCCRECQLAHWKAGHKEECAARQGAAGAGGGGGSTHAGR